MIVRYLAGLVPQVRLSTLLILLLLLAGLGSVAVGLVRVIRGLDLGLLLPVTFIGLWLGWSLAGARPVPGWLAGGVILALGIEAIVLRVGRLEGTVVALLHALADLAGQVWRWPINGPLQGAPVLQAGTELWISSEVLWIRLRDWLAVLLTDQPIFDPVAVALVWSLLVWLVSAWAGWMVRRRAQPLLGLAPAGALLAATLSYVGGSYATLLVLLGAVWLLLALVGHQAREQRWQASGVDFSLDIRIDLIMVVIPLALALVGLAGFTPSLSARQVAEAVQRLIWGQPIEPGPLANSLGLKPQPGEATAFDPVRLGGLPRRHLLGSGPELSRQVVMIIQTGVSQGEVGQSEISLPAAELPGGPIESTPLRYYWRSLTYDRYTGSGWITGRTEMATYDAGEPAIATIAPTQRLVQQAVQVVSDWGGLLYVAGTLVTVDRAYSVAWRMPGDAFGTTVATPAYRADSLVPIVGAVQLRTAGSLYPDWVQERYLVLPETVPDRVLALARDLTAREPTPYDRARAIEAYLRTFLYRLDLPAPPAERDVVDYFLFDLQQGYCDYYATAMVVLARAAGLPARLVVGYASGTYDRATARYIVSAAEAHSWVEIYFPGYGWIEFEPTAGRPALERPAEVTPPESGPDLAAASAAQTARPAPWGRWVWLGLASGLLLAFGGGVAWLAVEAWQLRRLTPAATIAVLYERLRRYGPRLAVPTWAGDTPYEFSAALANRVADLTQARWGSGLLAPAPAEVRWLAELYVRTSYSAQPPDSPTQVQAIQTWQRLRRRLWLAWLYRFSRP